MTDPSPSQTEPTEPAEGEQDAPDAAGSRPVDAPPRWSNRQPEPAPWYVGRPGAPVRPNGNGGHPGNGVRPGPGGPTGSQGADGHNGAGPDGSGQGKQGGQNGSGQNGEAPGQGGQQGQGGQGQGSGQPPQGQHPGAGPGRPGPYGPRQGGGQSPWHDPNRYGPPQRPSDQQRRGEPAEPRTPLDLRTRWARGLALGATACMMIALWYFYTDITTFPDFLISAAASLVLGLVGLWFGVFAQRDAMRKNKRAPEAVSSIVWNSIAVGISMLMIAGTMLLYSQLNQYANCMRSATTIALQNKCHTDFENSYGGRS